MSFATVAQPAVAGESNASLLSVFATLRKRSPDRTLFTFVDERGRDDATATPRELAFAAEGIARSLRNWGFVAGDRAVLVYAPSLDFVRAVLGCMIAGVVPVPAYPPDPFKRDQGGARNGLGNLAAIVADCGARAVLTHGTYDRARSLGAMKDRLALHRSPGWPDVPWHRTDRRAPAPTEPLTWHVPSSPAEPALLQYTSGSTAAPKGVVITHGNLSHEVVANARDVGLGGDTRGVFWVPQYHDLGLISVILSTLTGNSSTYLMSPLAFLQRPAVWFDVMSRVRATHTAAPNFAFDLAVRKTTPAMRERWDLSSVRVVMSAAEPIRVTTVRRFFAAFAASGLRRAAFYPAYGLAENSVSVSLGSSATLVLDRAALDDGRVVPVEDRDAAAGAGTVEVVGCGRVKAGTRVRIVDPDSRQPVPAGRVGEIWVDSPTKAAGYYGMPEQTREVFNATIADGGDPTPYLRTGDLGFLHDGELFVTGRAKDLIIIRGRNIYPQDLEESCRDAHPLIRPGGLAAFAVDADNSGDGTERLVLFVEVAVNRQTDGQAAEIVQAVRQRTAEAHQLTCHAVVLGRAGLVHKTTSGKVQRRACKQAFLNDSAQAAPSTLHVSRQATAPVVAQ